MIAVETTENDERLIVVKQLPVIEEQLQAIKQKFTEEAEAALSLACTEETLQAVRKKRSELSHIFDALETKRKEAKKAILSPYEAFEAVYKECVTDIYKPCDAALAKKIRKRGIESPIIFLTTSVEHAPESFETSTLRYLIKPIDPKKFYEAMDVAFACAEKIGQRLIKLKTENGVESVNASHIMCSEAHDHYQYVTLSGGEVIKVRMTVTELYALLAKHGGFIRVGSPYIINLRHVKNLSRTEVLLYNDVTVPIPRGKYAEIKNAFWDYHYEGQET